MNSVDRLLAYITQKQLSKREFYQKTGISNGYLDKVKNIGAGKLERIITAFPDLNFEWLTTGKGQMAESYAGLAAPTELLPNIQEATSQPYSSPGALRAVLAEKERLLQAKDQLIAAQKKIISSLQETIDLLKSVKG